MLPSETIWIDDQLAVRYLGEAAAAGVVAPLANFTVAAMRSGPFGSA